MRFNAAIATIAVILAPSVLAQNTTASDASTTTITRTVLQATATSTVVRSSGTAVPTSTSNKPSSSAVAATPRASASTISPEYMGAASTEQSSLIVVALAGAAVIAFVL